MPDTRSTARGATAGRFVVRITRTSGSVGRLGLCLASCAGVLVCIAIKSKQGRSTPAPQRNSHRSMVAVSVGSWALPDLSCLRCVTQKHES